MSPLALPIAELKPALTGLGKIIAKRTTLPVLNHIKIERTKDGWIALTATDLDHFITVRLEQPSDEHPGSLLVPYDELLKITKNCPKTDSLLLNGNDKAVTIQYAIGNEVAETKVDSLPVAEFPEIPRIKGEPIPVNDTLRQSIHEALECASIDETRLILNGAYIDTTKPGAHYVIGTDGRHLYSSNSFSLPLKESVIIPTHKFIGWKEFNNDGEWQLKVTPGEKNDDAGHLQISSRRWRYITRQIEGNFPNWRQVVPTNFGITLEFDPEQLDALADTIERLPDHDVVNHTVGIEKKERALNLLWKSDKEQPWKRLPITAEHLTGKDITIYGNRHHLIKALRFGLSRVELIDPLSPLRFSHEGRQMITMPVRAESALPPPPATPQAHETPPPAAPTPAAQEERTPMPRNTSGNGHTANAEKTTLETALEKIETIKGSYRDAIRGLNELTDTLKQIQREQKTTDKEVQSVRSTLEKLQTVKI